MTVRLHRILGALSIVGAVTIFASSGCGSSDSGGGELDPNDGGDGDGIGHDGLALDGLNIDADETGGCLPPCSPGTFCYAGACVAEQPPCKTDDTCQNDTYCDKATGKCVPYGPPGKDHSDDCVSVVPVGLFAPAVLCEFRAAPAGDKFATYLNVLATPTVATFEAGGTPSIVVPFYNGMDGSSEQDGILRVLSGNDCKQSANLGEVGGAPTFVSASSPVALGDLDGDKIPEIIAYSKPSSGTGGVIVFTKKAGAWSVLWRGHNVDTTPWTVSGPHEWAGPSVHDLDDDGKPEVLREAWVFDSTGKLLTGPPAGFVEGAYGVGQFPVVADIDGDGNIEMVNGGAIYRFDKTTKTWLTLVAAVTGAPSAGLVALADFGKDSVDGKQDGKAEVAVVASGQVWVESPGGAVVWGPIALPGTAGGGPPTIADFDGDGQPEIAVAGSDSYSVLDPDCQAVVVRPGGKCATGKTDGILWSRKSQDHSSNITGSSVFDFDADGIAEAIYADECFTRVYSGDKGDVVFSQYTSSCTWYENPIVADTNNDDRAELIAVGNLNCGTGTAGRACETGEVEYPDPARPSVPVDAIFSGLRCKAATDCVSGVCDTGFCRCTADAQCCPDKDDAKCMEIGFICMPPVAGTAGTGKTCRAAHPHGVAGVRVYHDFADRWVKSRNIWNQHAYSITNVNDDGTIPKTSLWTPNWKNVTPKYNDFRKNTPGSADPLKSPDLTAKGGASSCKAGKLTLSVQVCNRGASKAGDNYSVTFYEGDAADPTKIICTAKTTKPLDIAECQILSCDWATPPKSTPEDVTILIDAEGHVRNCNKNNKGSTIKGVVCAGPA